MKRAFRLLLIAFLNAPAVTAQTPAEGYIITKNNDTVTCTVQLPESRNGVLDEASLCEAVTVTDLAEKKHRYTPSNLTGFAFTYRGRTHRYLARPAGGKTYFLRTLVEGDHMTCYQYFKTFKGNPSLRTSVYSLPGVGPAAARKFYILETPDHRTLALDEINYMDIGRKLKAFFEGRPEQLKLYEETVKVFADVPYFAVLLNSQ